MTTIDTSLNGFTYVITSNADALAGSNVTTVRVSWIENGKRRNKRVYPGFEHYTTDPRSHIAAIKKVLGVDVLEPFVAANSHGYTWQVATVQS